MIRSIFTAGAVAAAMALGACSPQNDSVTVADPKPVTGVVTDTDAFARFIGSRPTAEAFRKAYPDVTLVMPGDISTREMRHDNSRYFAEVDENGRISGGRFM